MAKPEMPTGKVKLEIHAGLDGCDDCLDILIPMFEQLQLASADVASPSLDLLTFSHIAHFFGVLRIVRYKEEEAAEDHSKAEETLFQWSNDESDNADSSSAWGTGGAYDESYTPDRNVKFEETPEYYEEEIWHPSIEQNTWMPNLSGPSAKTRPSESSKGMPIPKGQSIAGLVYLLSSQDMDEYLRTGELRIGVIIRDRYRKSGYAREAIQKTLDIAFEDRNCHRVQAVLVDSLYKDRALSLFMKSGLGHEGVRRRAFRSPYDDEFKDVTYLGLLATDWLVRNVPGRKWVQAPKSMWDELFARHQREREELLRWEEKQLKRTSSMETVRQRDSPIQQSFDHAAAASAAADHDGDEEMYEVEEDHSSSDADVESIYASEAALSRSSSVAPSAKRRRMTEEEEARHDLIEHLQIRHQDVKVLLASLQDRVVEANPAAPMASGSGIRQQQTTPSLKDSALLSHRGGSPAFSDDSHIDSDGYATSTSSQWDVIEAASSSGLSDTEYDALNLDDDIY